MTIDTGINWYEKRPFNNLKGFTGESDYFSDYT